MKRTHFLDTHITLCGIDDFKKDIIIFDCDFTFKGLTCLSCLKIIINKAKKYNDDVTIKECSKLYNEEKFDRLVNE